MAESYQESSKAGNYRDWQDWSNPKAAPAYFQVGTTKHGTPHLILHTSFSTSMLQILTKSPKAQSQSWLNSVLTGFASPKNMFPSILPPTLLHLLPHSYREYQVRFNLTWMQDREIVRYKSWHYFVWDEETSGPGLSESDMITTLSLPLLGVHQQVAAVSFT